MPASDAFAPGSMADHDGGAVPKLSPVPRHPEPGISDQRYPSPIPDPRSGFRSLYVGRPEADAKASLHPAKAWTELAKKSPAMAGDFSLTPEDTRCKMMKNN